MKEEKNGWCIYTLNMQWKIYKGTFFSKCDQRIEKYIGICNLRHRVEGFTASFVMLNLGNN